MATIDEEVEVIYELCERLTKQDIEKLQSGLNMPAGIREQIGTDSFDFITTLKDDWEDFKPGRFHTCLHAIGRADLVPIASRIPWLCIPPEKDVETRTTRNIRTFIDLLKNELNSNNWKLILLSIGESVKGTINVKSALKVCIEKGLLTNNLEKFCSILRKIKRIDLVDKVLPYASIFSAVSNQALKRNLLSQSCERVCSDNMWQTMLRMCILNLNKDVSVILDEATESIDSIFVPLTIVKVKPSKQKEVEESSFSEIEFLRTMHEKKSHETLDVIDFEEIVRTHDPLSPALWCMLGNPGSGKSFLCKHFAYLYGSTALLNFDYVLSIPCRSREWHQLEETRHEKNRIVTSEFVSTWLQLSMSTGANWSKELSEHLVRSDGEGLFIIMDGADEFTRSVPFENTLLCKLLERQFLIRSTILLTSRPSAWYDFKYTYGAQFHIDSNFQVLGFSPANRDLYFQKRIETISKLNDVHEMFQRHDEIKQLSLVPVNASLLSSLFNATESILTQTLSHLYTQLIVYIVRRQLSRMELKEQSKILVMSEFHPAIRDCINIIGFEANQGIFERKLTSEKNISLTIDDKVYDSERLGLMQVHMKVVRFGVRVKVWTFQHLTIQEYMAAVSICNNSWTNQCFILRYLTSSVQYLSMYKMVIRFMSGILRQDAGRMTPILCRHTLPKPLSLLDAPMYSQLYYETSLVDMSDWREFTQSYLLLTTVISETNSPSIDEHFAYFKREFAYPLYLYFHSTISPNEWHCFLQSLSHIREYKIIHFQSDYVTSVQFQYFLSQIHSCSIQCLSLQFVEEKFNIIYPYTSILSSATLPPNTRISIQFVECNLTPLGPSQSVLPSTNQFAGNLNIYQSIIDEKTFNSLINQFFLLENFSYSPKTKESDSIKQVVRIQNLTSAHSLHGIYIDDPNFFIELPLGCTLSSTSSLKELKWAIKEDSYNVLPFLNHVSSLTYLQLSSTSELPTNNRMELLTELISTNKDSLKQIDLDELHRIGFHSWSIFLDCIASCSNLMTLKLSDTNFSHDDVSCWYSTISALESLVFLSLVAIPLQDSGMMVLCGSLVHHSALRWLRVYRCELSSASCHTLSCLIQILPKIRKIELYNLELSVPDSEPLQRLIQTAEKYSVEIQFLD